MGKGDRKSTRGKRFRKSYGVSRPKKASSGFAAIVPTEKSAPKAKAETKETETKKPAAKKAPAKKAPAAKKPTAKKAPAKKAEKKEEEEAK